MQIRLVANNVADGTSPSQRFLITRRSKVQILPPQSFSLKGRACLRESIEISACARDLRWPADPESSLSAPICADRPIALRARFTYGPPIITEDPPVDSACEATGHSAWRIFRWRRQSSLPTATARSSSGPKGTASWLSRSWPKHARSISARAGRSTSRHLPNDDFRAVTLTAAVTMTISPVFQTTLDCASSHLPKACDTKSLQSTSSWVRYRRSILGRPEWPSFPHLEPAP